MYNNNPCILMFIMYSSTLAHFYFISLQPPAPFSVIFLPHSPNPILLVFPPHPPNPLLLEENAVIKR
jgi:hypothetical protein